MQAETYQTTKIGSQEPDANQKSGNQPEPAEDNFFHHGAGNEEHLRAHEPKNRDMIVRVMRRNGGEHQRSARHGKHDKCFAAAPLRRNQSTSYFIGFNNKNSRVSK